MKTNSTFEPATLAFDEEAWFDPIETAPNGRIKEFIEELVEQETERRRQVNGTDLGVGAVISYDTSFESEFRQGWRQVAPPESVRVRNGIVHGVCMMESAVCAALVKRERRREAGMIW